MTHWDKIYQNYNKGGEAYATLSEEMLPEFIELFHQGEFSLKSAFDIGVGSGKYLKFLEKKGFSVAGIDNSQTAVEMTKKILKDSDNIFLADMFEYEIPHGKYDLILSVATVHHGYKNQVAKVIREIHGGLVENGYAFVTLPDWNVKEEWRSFKTHKELESGVITPVAGPEEGLPHSIYKKSEIEQLFSEFSDVVMKKDEIGRWLITAKK